MISDSELPEHYIRNMLVYDCRGNDFRRLDYEMIWKCKNCDRFLLTESVARTHSDSCASNTNTDDEESDDSSDMSPVTLNLYY